MSIVLIGVGQRLLSVRTKLNYPQSKMAAILGIANKSYNNYELEKRELPLSVAVNFCEEFDQNLGWLIYGITSPDIPSAATISAEVARAVFEFIDKSEKAFLPDEVAKFTHYLVQQSLSKGTSPAEEAKSFFSAIG